MAPDVQDLWRTYQERLRELRKQPIAGPLIAPLQLQADLIEGLLRRQERFEARVAEVLGPFDAVLDLARDAPATLRTQAKAFEAASVALQQAAEVIALQAELLDRTIGALGAPAELVRGLRTGDAPPNEPGEA